jgi:hypothetical protein
MSSGTGRKRASVSGSGRRPAQDLVLGPQRVARPQHRLDHPFGHRLPGRRLADPGGGPALADLADLEAEPARDSPDTQLDVQQLALQQLAPDQQGPDLLGRRRLAVHRPVPAHAQQPGDAARVLAVGLHDHGRERRLHVPRLQQRRLEPGAGQAGVQPLRQRPGLQPDPGQRQAEPAEEADERLGLARHLGLAHHPPAGIHHAHAAPFQGDVDPGIGLHGCPSLMPGADPPGPRTLITLGESRPAGHRRRRPVTASRASVGFKAGEGDGMAAAAGSRRAVRA